MNSNVSFSHKSSNHSIALSDKLSDSFKSVELIRQEKTFLQRLNNVTYVDFAGASLPTTQQLNLIQNIYLTKSLSNPHSQGLL